MPPTFFAEMLSKKIAEMPPLLLLGELRNKICAKQVAQLGEHLTPTFFAEMLSKKIAEMPPPLVTWRVKKKNMCQAKNR